MYGHQLNYRRTSLIRALFIRFTSQTPPQQWKQRRHFSFPLLYYFHWWERSCISQCAPHRKLSPYDWWGRKLLLLLMVYKMHRLLQHPLTWTIHSSNSLVILCTIKVDFSSYDASAYSDDFIFRGPYIGPLNKNDYFSTMDTFKVYRALPDINPNAWGFTIDPKYPSRVWYLTRNTGGAHQPREWN